VHGPTRVDKKKKNWQRGPRYIGGGDIGEKKTEGRKSCSMRDQQVGLHGNEGEIKRKRRTMRTHLWGKSFKRDGHVDTTVGEKKKEICKTSTIIGLLSNGEDRLTENHRAGKTRGEKRKSTVNKKRKRL